MIQAIQLVEESADPDEALRLAMAEFLFAFGFTALRLAISRIESELSKEHRNLLALQGWIA